MKAVIDKFILGKDQFQEQTLDNCANVILFVHTDSNNFFITSYFSFYLKSQPTGFKHFSRFFQHTSTFLISVLYPAGGEWVAHLRLIALP